MREFEVKVTDQTGKTQILIVAAEDLAAAKKRIQDFIDVGSNRFEFKEI